MLQKLIKGANILVEILLPRYITEHVAFYEREDGALAPAWPVSEVNVDEDGEPDGVMELKSLSWFGVSWFVKSNGPLIEWQSHLINQK